MLTARQIAEWQAFDELEPVGEGRGDARTMALCAAVMRWGGGEALKITDYMPWFADREGAEDEEPREETTVPTMTKYPARSASQSRVVILGPDDDPQPTQTPEEMKQVFQSIAKSHGTRPRKLPH